MRFPFALTKKIASHIIKHKLRKTPKFAMVLQLEPLHTCNMTCTGCGRIREYSTSLKDMVPLDQCLQAAIECDAPMVSICGGEPLMYPKIEELIAGLLEVAWAAGLKTSEGFTRLWPTVATFVAIARRRGGAGYVGDGANRWPAVHRSDAARRAYLAEVERRAERAELEREQDARRRVAQEHRYPAH